MARELEAKYRVADAAALRRRLDAAGAQHVSTVGETNLILDDASRQLLKRGCGLRLRIAAPLAEAGARRVTLTFKGPRDPDLHARGIKAREELETEITDDTVLLALFAQLGFKPVLGYEKRRETWRLGDAEIVVDELPQLGWFVEIEAPAAAALEFARRQLGLDQTAAVPETYPELTARHGTPDAGGARCLRFGAGTT